MPVTSAGTRPNPTISANAEKKNQLKQRFLNNVRLVAERKNINIGELEEKAEVSTGYFSRLSKEGNNTSISVDIASAVAKSLGTSVDLLIDGDYSAIGENERFVIDFIQSMIQKTENGTEDWTKFPAQELYRGVTRHPLIEHVPIQDEKGSRYAYKYDSAFFDDWNVELSGDIFEANNYNGDCVIITSIIHQEFIPYFGGEDEPLDVKSYELYIFDNDDNLEPICNSGMVSDELSKELARLFKMVSGMHANVKVNPRAKSVMKNFMLDHEEREPEPYDPDELPF